jgi:hypothetical protein
MSFDRRVSPETTSSDAHRARETLSRPSIKQRKRDFIERDSRGMFEVLSPQCSGRGDRFRAQRGGKN